MDCTGLVIFNYDTQEPIKITSFKTNKKDTHGVRLNQLRTEVKKLMTEYPPYKVAIERGLSRFNTATQVIYRVHGVINELLKDYEQNYYPPKKVKAAIVNGKATKKQVQEKIIEMYSDIKFRNEDESDAFAVGLTYFIEECEMKLT